MRSKNSALSMTSCVRLSTTKNSIGREHPPSFMFVLTLPTVWQTDTHTHTHWHTTTAYTMLSIASHELFIVIAMKIFLKSFSVLTVVKVFANTQIFEYSNLIITAHCNEQDICPATATVTTIAMRINRPSRPQQSQHFTTSTKQHWGTSWKTKKNHKSFRKTFHERFRENIITVSYTHLTLPTILRV